jgi:hypothetical protein
MQRTGARGGVGRLGVVGGGSSGGVGGGSSGGVGGLSTGGGENAFGFSVARCNALTQQQVRLKDENDK